MKEIGFLIRPIERVKVVPLVNGSDPYSSMNNILSLSSSSSFSLLLQVNDPAPVISPSHSKPSDSNSSSSGRPITIFAPLGVSTPSVRLMSYSDATPLTGL